MMACFESGHHVVERLRHREAGARAMRIRKRNSGSAAAAALLALLIVIMVVATVYVFVTRPPWSVPPDPITSVGAAVDHQYQLTLYRHRHRVCALATRSGLRHFSVSRSRPARSLYRGNNTLEIGPGATIILFLGLGVMARHAWSASHFTRARALMPFRWR